MATPSADLAATQEVAFRNHADQVASVVDDGQPADVHPKHDLRGFLDRRVRGYGDDVSRHDMNCVHFLVLGRLMKR